MKRKLFFKTTEELNRLNLILIDKTERALKDIKFNYKNVYSAYQVGFVGNNAYEYFKVYINEKASDRQFFFTVDMDAIEQWGFYRKLKRSLKLLTKGIDLR